MEVDYYFDKRLFLQYYAYLFMLKTVIRCSKAVEPYCILLCYD